MSIYFRLIVVVFVLIFSATNSNAGTKVIRFTLIDSYPWAFKTKKSKLEGIYPRLLEQLQKTIRVILLSSW